MRQLWAAAAAAILSAGAITGCGGGPSEDRTSSGGPTGRIGALIAGVVRDSVSGQVISNARITLTPRTPSLLTPPPVTTDAQGRYGLGGLDSGDYDCRVETPDLRYQGVTFMASVAHAIGTVSATMVPASVAEPTHLDVAFPPPGIRVGETARFSATSRGRDVSQIAFWTVQPAGRAGALIGAVNADGTFTATNTGVGLVQAQIGRTTATAQITVSDNTGTGGIFGIVTDSGSVPVAGATVTLSSGASVTSAIDGSFTLATVAPGTYTVSATLGAASGSADQPVAVAANQVAAVQVKIR